MSLSSSEIIALADKYQIDASACVTSFTKCAAITLPNFDAQSMDECCNHLDTEFMTALKNAEFLNVDSLPLHI